ncbi:ribonuclease H-like domain-containing protein, partial [Tanacetum coccineum]
MDLESTQNNVVAKLPFLQQESGNSFKPAARVTTNADGTSTSTTPGAVTAEERIQKKNDVKARKSLDSIFNSLQKLVSQLSILGENISQEDLNLKFLRSLPAEWNTHVVVWRNKPDLESMSIDDLYNNFKIVEQEVKRSGSSSSNSGTASTPVSAASTNDNAASLSDATVYAFLANQPSGSQFVHEDLEQIHNDDLEEMDLKWQLALLSMRARKFYQRTGKKITINGSDTARFDKSKVECFNCHKLGHFAREYRNPRSQESRPKSYDQGSSSQDKLRRTTKIEDTSSKAMVAIDGARFDWSYMVEEEVPTNIALMAFSDSEYDNLRVEFNKSEFDLANYKRGLASVEEQLVFYKKNKVMFTDQITLLKRDASFNESEIIALKMQIEKLKKDKEDNFIKIDNYENASKSLDKLIGSQLTDNNRKGVGYNAVPPPPTGLFSPPTIDLSNTGLEEFKQPEFEGYGVKVNKSACENSSTEIKKTPDAPIIEDSSTKEIVTEKVQQLPEQANKPRNVRQNSRYNSANRNEMKTQRLGVGFQFSPKACFVCGSFSHLIKDCDFHDKKVVQKLVLNNVQKGTGQREGRPVWNNALRTNHQNFSNSRRNFTPTAVLTKSGKVLIDTSRQSSSRAAVPVSTASPINTIAPKSFVNVAKPITNALQKTHSPSRRPFYPQTTLKNRNLKNKVNTVKINSVNTAKTKQVKSVVGKQGINVVKPSACWVWRPKSNVINHISKTSGSYICKSFNYVDPTGRL